jgi:hypothetical protein
MTAYRVNLRINLMLIVGRLQLALLREPRVFYDYDLEDCVLFQVNARIFRIQRINPALIFIKCTNKDLGFWSIYNEKNYVLDALFTSLDFNFISSKKV